MADKYPEPLLDLDSLIERPKITIDGQPYEIASPDELSVIDRQRLAWLGRKFDNLLKRDGSDQSTELTKTLTALADIVLAPIPAEIRAKLSDAKVMAVIEVFTMLSHASRMQLAGATLPQILKSLMAGLPATGEKPSPDSSDTMAATRQAG